MGVLEIINLELQNIAGHDICKMKKYGEMHEWCNGFSNTFNGGKSYALIGECGSGGWFISSILAGRSEQSEGEILLNGISVSKPELKSMTCYVGESVLSKKIRFRKNSIKEQISAGIKNSKLIGYTKNDIAELFGLREDRLSYNVEELSWSRWRASIAIGFANNKKIFCFPWCNSWMIDELILNGGIHRCIDILTQNGAIVIIPTGNQGSVDYFIDEIIKINNRIPSERSKEIVSEYNRRSLRE